MTDKFEKLDLRSHDITQSRIDELKQLFPEVFHEGKIDFFALQRALEKSGAEGIDAGKERFGLSWVGKSDCMKLIQQSSTATLLPMRDASVNFDTSENVIIEGDNLEVLKLLQKSYYGKVKMIYIDPPYNTGNEFIYPDNFQDSLKEYLKYTGQVDAEGYKQSANTETDGRYHSNWLNMMYPRLFLARNLLRDDGVIFISIDDHEVHHLRVLMNEIFGEENFVTQFCWKRRTGANDSKKFYVSSDHEYIICYAKREDFSFLGINKDLSNYNNPDNDVRGAWARDNLTCNKTSSERPNLFYPITDPSTGIIYECNPNRVWAYEKVRMNKIISEGKVMFPKTASGTPMYKRHLSELRSDKKPVSSWVKTYYVDDSDDSLSFHFPLNMMATKELRELMDGQFFDFPKSPHMIKQLMSQVLLGGDIILDFFAGSGTTAHAVMDLNKEDGGNRKYILVQLPEKTENSEFPTIADITRERVRRVIKKHQTDEPNVSLGFKAYQLASSNFSVWQGSASDVGENLALFVDNVNPDRSREDISYELLLKAGYSLTEKIEILSIEGKTVYAIANGALLICLEKNLTLPLMEALITKSPTMIICLDEGFQSNDQLKVNVMQTIKTHNQQHKGNILFRVV